MKWQYVKYIIQIYRDDTIDITDMICVGKRQNDKGFALPTVMIASVVMLIVLLAGLVSVSSINVSLKGQYYDKVLNETIESGVAMANMCLDKNSQIATWGQPPDNRPLKPNTDCSGNVVSGVSQYIADTTNSTGVSNKLRTSFSVPSPTPDASGTQRINVEGKLDRFRTSDTSYTSAVESRITTSNAIVGAQNNFDNVAFGYNTASGAQFVVVLPSGEVKGVGINSNGRLGNGKIEDSLTPSTFILPSNAGKGDAAFTNFLSVGWNVYVITKSGKVFGAGNNNAGQLGTNTVSTQESTPVQFNLPSGVSGRFVASLTDATFVLGDNNIIYAAGACTGGSLGTDNGASGCSTTSTPTPVQLPAVTTDLNTQPESENDWIQPTNIAADRFNVLVRMKGGAVYGWGSNADGQLGDGTTTLTAQPKRIGVFGNSGQPKATQVAFDGETSYILDDQGDVYSFGSNRYGDLAGSGSTIMSNINTQCMRNVGGTSVNSRVRYSTCNDADVNQVLYWHSDNTIRIKPSPSVEYCLAAFSTYVRTEACSGSDAQQWYFDNNGEIRRKTSTTTCMYSNTAGNSVDLYSCPGTTDDTLRWTLNPSLTPRKVPMPASAGDPDGDGDGNVRRISTDNGTVLFLTTGNQVWGAGSGARGILGTGPSFRNFYPALVRYSNFEASNIYVTTITADGGNGSEYNNAYAIDMQGNVYGTGSNTFGQIGLGKDINGTDITGDNINIPTKMKLPNGVMASSVQSGFGTTVVLTTRKNIYTVGNNSSGQLGDGTRTSSSVPKANAYTNQRQTITY